MEANNKLKRNNNECICKKYAIRVASRAYEIINTDVTSEDWDKNKQKRAEMVKEKAEKLRNEKILGEE